MKKVIITKDVKGLLEKEKSFFNRSDIRTFPVASNERALAVHRSINADLIIANLSDPGMSGEKLCSLIRDDDGLRNVSLVIVCSGTETDLERCMLCRANAFISSPIDSALLLQEAHRLLNIAPRTSWRIPIRVSLQGKAKGVPFTGIAENISTSGMLFRSAAVLFEGDAVTCSFLLSGAGEITVKAEIVRVIGADAGQGAHGYGIRFIGLGARVVAALKALVEKECQHAGHG